MLGRLLIAAALISVFGCALVSCGDGGAGSGETLRWRTAVDVPMNFQMKVGQNLTSALLPASCKDLPPALLPPSIDCDKLTPAQEKIVQELINSMPSSYLLNLGSGSVPTTSDVIDVLRKLTDTKIEYSAGITNSTSAKLTFYGMLFKTTDKKAADASIDTFFNYIALDSINGGRVNILGPAGLPVESGKTDAYPPRDAIEDTLKARALSDLIIGKGQKAFAWRWLVKLEKSEFDGLEKDTANTTDSVTIKLRIRFSGVNSVDSLFTL